MDIFGEEELEPRKEPKGGWKEICIIADHKWSLEVEGGSASLRCLDPHPEEFSNQVNPVYGPPVCLSQYWESDDLHCEGIPVQVRHVDDSTPSTPMGPAEYGFWIEIKSIDAE